MVKESVKYIYVMVAVLTLFVVMPEKSYASSNESPTQVDQFSNSEEILDLYIEQLESYIIVNEDNTLSLNPAYNFELDIPSDFVSGIEENLFYLNELIKSDKAIVNSDLSITILDEPGQLSMSNSVSLARKGCGRSGHDVYWWGYNIFLNCNETRTVYQSFKAGGSAAAGIAAISRFIPAPPTQLASAISAAIGGGLVGFGQMIQDEHQGHGVRLRFTGLGYAAVPSGIFPQ